MLRTRSRGELAYRALAVAVVAAIVASTAVLLVAIAVSSGEQGRKPPVGGFE